MLIRGGRVQRLRRYVTMEKKLPPLIDKLRAGMDQAPELAAEFEARFSSALAKVAASGSRRDSRDTFAERGLGAILRRAQEPARDPGQANAQTAPKARFETPKHPLPTPPARGRAVQGSNLKHCSSSCRRGEL